MRPTLEMSTYLSHFFSWDDDSCCYLTRTNSCSEDGSVVITCLRPTDGGALTPPEVYNYGAKWPMLAVKLDPHYARRYGLASLMNRGGRKYPWFGVD